MQASVRKTVFALCSAVRHCAFPYAAIAFQPSGKHGDGSIAAGLQRQCQSLPRVAQERHAFCSQRRCSRA
eukprot:6006109-Alexandrium_andersonii.AAC.1